jgi:hypothetical protein
VLLAELVSRDSAKAETAVNETSNALIILDNFIFSSRIYMGLSVGLSMYGESSGMSRAIKSGSERGLRVQFYST